MNRNKKGWIGAGIVLFVLIVLLNPGWLTFLPADVRQAISQQMGLTFGRLLAGDSLSITLPKLLAVAAMIMALWLACKLLDWLVRMRHGASAHQDTVAGLLSSVIRYAAVIVGIIWGFSIMGVDVSAILASLGIIGLIVGFGAQSLIEDIITGMFIIFEKQYEVGDIIVLDDFRGTVRKIEVRTTTIEDDGGNLKVVNNSDIRNFQNRSRVMSCAVTDVKISYDCPKDEVAKVLTKAFAKARQEHAGLFASDPQYLGIEEFADSGYIVRSVASVTEADLYKARRALNDIIMAALEDAGITIGRSAAPVARK